MGEEHEVGTPGQRRVGTAEPDRRVGVVGIVITDRGHVAARVQEVLSRHGDMIVGRMGIPYRERNLAVIALIVDGTTDQVGALTGRLGQLPGVLVRSALAPPLQASPPEAPPVQGPPPQTSPPGAGAPQGR